MTKPVGDLGKTGKLLLTLKSDSSEDVYEVREQADGKLTCTCIGFQTSRRRPKSCKHTRRYWLLGILKNIYNWNISNEQFPASEPLDLIHECKEIERLFKKEV